MKNILFTFLLGFAVTTLIGCSQKTDSEMTTENNKGLGVGKCGTGMMGKCKTGKCGTSLKAEGMKCGTGKCGSENAARGK